MNKGKWVQSRLLIVCVMLFAIACDGPSAIARAADVKALNAGNALLKAKSYTAAEAVFRKAVAEDPNDTKVMQGLVTALDKQGKYEEEATVAEQMANVYVKQANQPAAAPAPIAAPAPAVAPAPAQPSPAVPAEPVAAGDKDVEIAKLKQQLAAMEAAKTPTAAPDAAAAPEAAQALAASNVPLQPLDKSEMVSKGPNGDLGVAKKDGTPIEGFKLSQHDMAVTSPSIAVGTDGTIHVAFVEKHSTTFANAVYYRSSADGGKTWTEAKNLSEDMANIDVACSSVLVDAHNRVYVVWRAGLKETWTVSFYPTGDRTNLFFRELEGGKWSKAKPISELCTQETQLNSAYSFFTTVDAAGRVQVLWNVIPDKWHPELLDHKVHSNGIQNGLVFQSSLDGTNVSKPREVYLPVITQPANAWEGPSCDGLNTINGYVDSAGAAHFVAAVTRIKDGQGAHPSHYELIENGKAGQDIDLPNASFHEWKDIPTLLVDAKGRRHVIALYLAGEHPNFRDYLLGSDDEPTVILAAPGLQGVCIGFQAFQGPGGHMVVIMQVSKGMGDLGDTFVSMSDGTAWSQPVNITNNAARAKWASVNTGGIGSVGHGTSYRPDAGAAAFDHDGHLVLALINAYRGSFGSSVGGVLIASGSTDQPMLYFYKF